MDSPSDQSAKSDRTWPQAAPFAAVGAASVALPIIVMLVWRFAWQAAAPTAAAELVAGMQLLDAGDFSAARAVAESLLEGEYEALGGGPDFLYGASIAYEAERLPGEDRRRFAQLAAGSLQRAETLAWPTGRAQEGAFLLGRSLLLTGEADAARAYLRNVVDRAKYRLAALRLLAESHLRQPDPQYGKALAYLRELLAEQALSRQARDEALLLMADVQLRLGQNRRRRGGARGAWRQGRQFRRGDVAAGSRRLVVGRAPLGRRRRPGRRSDGG